MQERPCGKNERSENSKTSSEVESKREKKELDHIGLGEEINATI